MQENIDQNSWKYKIAEQIVSSYAQFKKSSENKTEECKMSYHFFENVIIKELLWHATTIIEGRKVVSKGQFKGDYIDNTNEMINIKIVGQRYWTKNAMEKYKENNKGENDYKIGDGLIHEHAVPRNIIKQEIIEELESTNSYDNKCIDKVFNIINNLSKSVIVTKKEDKELDGAKLRQKMPEDWDGKDWRARYNFNKIEIHDINKLEEVDHDKKFKNILFSKLESIN
jgi:hypothetical protein|tara:strand:- start:234 stop:914 length:681 start_codon:yes stop_codon:yes gene_type:complete